MSSGFFVPRLDPEFPISPPPGGGFNQVKSRKRVSYVENQEAIAPCLDADPCQDRARPRLVGIATAAYCELIGVCRLMRDAYGGAAELYNDERDALRANQAHTEAKAVCLLVLMTGLY